MDTVWKTNGVKRVDCCPYCTLAFCSVISISTQGLITPLHYTMSGAPGSRLRHAPFDWLWLGFSAQLHPKGLAGKQEEGPETAHIIPDSIGNRPTKLDPSEVCKWKQATLRLMFHLKPVLSTQLLNVSSLFPSLNNSDTEFIFNFFFLKHKNTWQKKSNSVLGKTSSQ